MANIDENKMNEIVKEYLESAGYVKTSASLDEEIQEKGKTPVKSLNPPRRLSALINAQRDMLRYYRDGNHEAFFQTWTEALPAKIRNEDSVALKLEFYLNIYFAIFPIRKNPEDKESHESAMRTYRQYLENRGSSLSQTTEFLPFYALPYVPNPKTHPSFKEIFSEHWIPDLEQRLNRFLQLALETNRQPRLVELVNGVSQVDAGQLKKLQSQLAESERRTMQYMRRHNRVQVDYHNLIGITAELVDYLEDSLRGKPVSTEFLQQVCARLFASQQVKHSLDLSRPGTAAKALRQSLRVESGTKRGQSVERNGFGDATPRFLNREPLYPNNTPTELDLDKIKYDLQNADDRRKCLLYQALRWRLTKVSAEQRELHLSEYIANDLLGSSQPGPHRQAVFAALQSQNPLLREYVARLFNTLASLSRGRSYLSQDIEVLHTLFQALKNESKDSVITDNILGVLQKLSLRRSMQTALIQCGVIEWAFDYLLHDSDAISDYCFEYSVALVMNLCLRTAGKNRCAPIANKVLKTLSDLLGHDNREIISYVNGALYSVVSVPSIREEAKKMDLEGILKCYMKDDQPDTNRQLNFIIQQINAADEAETGDSDDEEEEDDEEDTIEVDIDQSEALVPTSPREAVGDQLLAREYSRRSQNGVHKSGQRNLEAEMPLSRPITPGTRAAHLSKSHDPEAMTRSRNPQSSRRESLETSQANPAAGDQPGETTGNSTARGARVSVDNPEYKQAFAAKPKIPRTPDQQSIQNRHQQRGPLMPTYSDRLPTDSRPNSSGYEREGNTTRRTARY